jgi:DNA invertase Pin-like site-specific DNA recombinase
MIMERIKEAEAGFRSLTKAIDTTTAPGRMMMQMAAAFAEFERAILRERTKAGLDAARKHGRIGGRRQKLRPNQQDEIVTMVSTGTKTAADAARLFNVHPATVSRLLARAGAGTISVKAYSLSPRKTGLRNRSTSTASPSSLHRLNKLRQAHSVSFH